MRTLNRIRSRFASRRREDPFADSELFKAPAGEAQTTMFPAPGPATDVSGAVTDTMPRVPAGPPQDFQFRGEWDTPSQRQDVAEAFRPSPAVQQQLAQIRERARRETARADVDEQTAYWDRPDDLMVSEHTGPAMNRAYAQPPAPDQTRFDLAAAPYVPPPVSAAECWGHAELVVYPPPADPTAEQWAATLQQWGELTGTWTDLQQPNAWRARSVPSSAPLAPLTVDGLHEVPDETVKPGAQLAVIETGIAAWLAEVQDQSVERELAAAEQAEALHFEAIEATS